jgi:predicted GNAT family acetyltransferase
VEPSVTYREINVREDMKFILSSWVKTEGYSSDYFRNVEKYISHAEITKKVLRKIGESYTILVTDSADPSHIIGYINYLDGGIINMIYIKSKFRGLGYAKGLMKRAKLEDAEEITATSYPTPKLKQFFSKKILKFNPYL